MAYAALVNGRPMAATKVGTRGVCLDPKCAAEMIAKPGNGTIRPHWAHRTGGCELDDRGEQGWHRTWRTLFLHLGAETEVHISSHIADIRLADGRVIEFQTRMLAPSEIVSRERTYAPMAWIYRMTDGQVQAGEPMTLGAPITFTWTDPHQAMTMHDEPVYWHTSNDTIWSITSLWPSDGCWRGTATVVSDDWVHFAEAVTEGMPFGAPIESLERERVARQHAFAIAGMRSFDIPDGSIPEHYEHRPAGRRIPFVLRDAAGLAARAHLWATHPKCSACGRPMCVGQRITHYTCAPAEVGA